MKNLPKLTPAQAKKLAIELLARAMTPDIVKLARANKRATGNAKHSVEAAMDAYEPHRILMEEIGDKVVQRVYRLADQQLKAT